MERIQAGAKWNPGFNEKPIPPRLSVLTTFIRETWPELTVTLEPWTSSTDRKIGRLCWPGAGRKGKRLEVKYRRRVAGDPLGVYRTLLSHTSSETYRHNGEVCEWIVKRLASHPPKKTLE